MNSIEYFAYQFLLFSALLLLNVFADSYISQPFSSVDFIAICISVPIAVFILSVIFKIYKRFQNQLRNKLILLVTAFILAIIVIVIGESIWFEIKGEMLF